MALSFSKKLSALLREITSKQVGNFYCLNSLHLSRTKNKLESQKKCVKIRICTINKRRAEIVRKAKKLQKHLQKYVRT